MKRKSMGEPAGSVQRLADSHLAVIVERDRLRAKTVQLRAALAAYRSAIRSGEPETNELRRFGDEALGQRPPVSTDRAAGAHLAN